MFNGSVNSNTIYKGKTLVAEMPQQIESELLGALVDFGAQTTDSVRSLVMGNFALNILMSSSMTSLWVLINALQVLIHVPIFQIVVPLNAKIFFLTLSSITNFELLPTSQINRFLFSIDETNPFKDQVNSNFLDMDIF